MRDNPFAPRDEFKKRVVAVSLTADQQDALLELQIRLGLKTQGAVVKLALERLYASEAERCKEER